MISRDVLMDAFGRQAEFALDGNDLTKGLALTAPREWQIDRFDSCRRVTGPDWRLYCFGSSAEFVGEKR